MRAYGSDGDWAQLFAQAPGFIEVVLLASADQPGRYLTIDRWRDRASYEHFLTQHADAYAELDDRLAAVSGRGTELGRFARR